MFGMCIAEPSFERSLAERSTELLLPFGANALLFAGLGYPLQALFTRILDRLRCFPLVPT